MMDNSANELTLNIGDKFESFDELHETVKKYCELQRQFFVKGATTLISGSKHAGIPNEDKLKYLYITYKCVFFGKARTQATERETRIKKRIELRKSEYFYPNSTVKKGCQALFKVKLNLETKDRLEIYEIDLVHKHHESSEAFIHMLPCNRKLSPQTKEEVQKTLMMGGNAKMIKNDLAANKQKILLNKDLANIKAQAKKTVETPNDLKTFSDLLRTEYGCTVDTLCDEDLVFKALFSSNKQMRHSMSAWPEMVLVDGTYKLTNRNLTLLIFLVQNGIGRGEVVGSALLASEDKDSLKWVTEKFKEKNPQACQKIRVFMTDKDLTERDALREVFSSVKLLLCRYHVMKAFKLWLNSNVPKKHHDYLEKLIQKLVYCSSEEEYEELYSELMTVAPTKFKDYYNKNWHGIKDDWIQCKTASENFGNFTNNLLESLNHLIKQMVKRNSTLYEFGRKYFQFLQSHNQETDIRSALQILKTPTKVVTGDYTEYVSQYCTYLTQHAFKNLQNQFKLLEAQTLQIQDEKTKKCIIKNKHGIITSSPTECSCQFRSSYDLPCKHIFAVRKFFKMSLYEPSLCAERWTKNYTLENHRLKAPNTSGLADDKSSISAGPSIDVTPRKKKLTTSHKRKLSNAKGNSLADFLFNSCDLRFENRCSTIDQVFDAWGIGDEVKILRVKAGEGSTDSPMKNPVTEQVHTPQRTLTEDNLVLPVTRRIFGKPSGSGKTTSGFFPRRQKPGS